ncbi:flagellar filament capping protein FliD [Oceanospirillaceae bacterium]|jgi:flagellar hook-associated protein 2|nr:flagellar filament capping protein FliD [Oceanospirillaceae bacterium]|tara:strand:+ start:628 stop:2655 length:2028 start_codon:yes stop_codon:yes gene_type:complete
MATDYLQALGVGAGFDTKAIVTALVDAEKAPKQSAIDRRTKDVDASVSGMAQLKSSLTTLQTAFQSVDDKRDFNFSTLANSAPTILSAQFDTDTALPGTYKVSVSQLAQNDVYQSAAVAEALEVDTYTLSGAINASGSASFTYGGITYTQAFNTDSATTMSGLVAAINAGAAGSTVTAFATNSTTFTITKDAGSDTQMTKGVVGGTTDGSTSVTGSTADTTAGIGATTVDQNGTSAATVVIQVGSGAAETVTLASGSTSLTDLVTGINALNADVSARLVETSTGSYRVVVEGPQGSDNALTITDSVFGLQTTNVPEVDTYTLGAGVATNGSAVFTYNGTTYTQAFDTSDVVTLTALTAQITAADSSVTAANGTSGTVFTITRNVGSDTQMTKGTIGGTSNGSAALTISTADTTNGSDGNKIQSAQNAAVSVNGLSVSSASNQLNGVIPGVKLDLMATTSSAVVLSVGRDTSVAQAAITNLVDVYNTFEGVIKGLSGSATATEDEGSLKEDAAVRAIRTKVRAFLTASSSTPGASKGSMADIGVSLQKDGLFKVNQVTLGSALTNYYADITQMFSANTDDQSAFGTASRGIAGDLVNQISSYLASDGVIKLRETSYTTTKAAITTEQKALDTKMESVEARYTKQFSTMSKIMDEMKSTQEYLESSLGNLPFTAKND